MTELEQLRAAKPPRDDATCRKLAWRVEPLMGFITYGVLWNVFGSSLAFTGGMFAGIALASMISSSNKDLAAYLALGLGLLCMGVSVWLFVRWYKRRRAGAIGLVRDGVFADGKVVDRASDQAAQVAARLAFAAAGQRLALHWHRVQFTHDITGYHVLVPFAKPAKTGDLASVFFKPGYKYALAFDPSGKGFPCKLHET